MTQFIKLTSIINPVPAPIFVNMALIQAIEREDKKTWLYEVGNANAPFKVLESPGQILALIEGEKE